VKDRIDTEDEIKKAERYEALKQMLLRLLDDPQVQQKIASSARHRSTAIGAPGRPDRYTKTMWSASIAATGPRC
jgi:hypothetical protein